MSTEQDKLRERPTSRLVEAVRQVKLAAADKSDVVVEMREADRTRLELLAQELAPVIEDVPQDDERFDFALSSGLQPRFWIDATAHVMMGPDRRTYRFVRDTRLGRILLAESTDKAKIADKVTSYIADRIHERELMMAGETLTMREIVAGKVQELDGGPRPQDKPAGPVSYDDRIDRAAEALKEQEREKPAKAADDRKPSQGHSSATGMKRISPEDTAPRGGNRSPHRARSFAGGLMWLLLGAAIGGGVLAWLFRDLIV